MQKLTASATINSFEFSRDPVRAQERALEQMLDQIKAAVIDYSVRKIHREYSVELHARVYVATEEEFHAAVHQEALRLTRLVSHLEIRDDN